MKRFSLLAALLSSTPAFAGAPFTVENCAYRHRSTTTIFECDVSNRSDVAIASIRYSALVLEPGRAVPWMQMPEERASIQGGIEPNETIRHVLGRIMVPQRANLDAFIFEITPISANGSDGNTIEFESENGTD